jgi:hypothetical protein
VTRKITDDERRLAILPQVLRHRELDLLTEPFTDRQTRRRVGAVAADERRVLAIVAEVGILELAPLDAEGVEADGTAGDAEKIGREKRQRRLGVGRSHQRRRDLAGCASALIRGEIDCRPLQRSRQRHRDVLATEPCFRRDVELGMNVAAVGE